MSEDLEEGKFFCSYCTHTRGNDKLIDEYLERLSKPWKDPDSLFCSSETLTEILKKPIAKGKECKGRF